jgi:hypothetical protein
MSDPGLDWSRVLVDGDEVADGSKRIRQYLDHVYADR